MFSFSLPHSSSSSSSCLLCPPLLLLSSFSSETECWVVDRLDTVEELVVVEMFREVEPRLCCGPLDCLCSCNSFSNRLTCDSCCSQQDSAADRVGGVQIHLPSLGSRPSPLIYKCMRCTHKRGRPGLKGNVAVYKG